jgi:hypothetical protein
VQVSNCCKLSIEFGRRLPYATHVWKSLAGFSFEAELFLDEATIPVILWDRDSGCAIRHTLPLSVSLPTLARWNSCAALLERRWTTATRTLCRVVSWFWVAKVSRSPLYEFKTVMNQGGESEGAGAVVALLDPAA